MNQKVQINAHPHKGQVVVHASPARFKILSAGRRWGKTRLGVNECIDVAGRGGRAWWVAPSYKMSDVGWRPLRQMAAKVGASINLVDRRITFSSGGEVSVRSADNPDSLRGESLNLVIMDECAFMKSEAWSEALRPALADRLGRAIFISTPKGRNWFWRLWQMGQQGDPEWESWQFPTATNPYIVPSEIEAARLTLPERVFRQEFLAEFLDDAGGVFRRVMEAATATEQDAALAGHQYIAGVDVADMVDFTVVSVIDVTTNELCYLDRFNRVGYPVLEDRLAALYGRFTPAQLIIESNSIGQPVIDHLRERNIPVRPFRTTSATKEPVIQGLQAAFEHGRLKILNDPVLIGELQAFEAKRTQSGGFSYSAPEGLHDDCVMSLALAWSGADRPVIALGSEW